MSKVSRSAITGFGLACLAATLAWLCTDYVAVLREGTLLLDDFRLAYFAEPFDQRKDIVILAINEDTLAQLPFRSPIDRRMLADLVRELGKRNVQAIGIDVIFDQPTTAADDSALLAALDRFAGPVVVAIGDESNGLTPRQLQFQSHYLAGRTVGLAGMLLTDGVVRHIYPGEHTADGFRPSFVSALAAEVGVHTPAAPQRLYFRRLDAAIPPIRNYPAHTLQVLPRDWFDGAIVLIGADLPNQDAFRTPLSVVGDALTMTGINIHGHALAQLLEGVEFPAVGRPMHAGILGLAALLGVALPFSRLRLPTKAVIGLGTVAAYWVFGFAWFAAGGMLVPILPATLSFGLAVAFGGAYARRHDQLEKRFIRNAFGRYVSPSIIERVLADPAKLVLGGEKREMSFVFSDLEGFTTLTEKLAPEAAVALLQEYLDGMLQIAFDFGGVVDRLVGDGIAVFFGAPTDQPDHAKRAVQCALAWDRYGEQFRQAQAAKGITIGITRIGAHTGSAVVGNVGSAERFHYTAHGDCVNTAARLESVNRHLGTRACLSKALVQHYPEAQVTPVGRLVLKGKTEDIECVTPVLDWPEQARTGYLAAYHLLDTDPAASTRSFAHLCEQFPQQRLLHFHLDRLRRGQTGTRIVLEAK